MAGGRGEITVLRGQVRLYCFVVFFDEAEKSLTAQSSASESLPERMRCMLAHEGGVRQPVVGSCASITARTLIPMLRQVASSIVEREVRQV